MMPGILKKPSNQKCNPEGEGCLTERLSQAGNHTKHHNQTKVNLVRDCDGETPARALMMRNRGEQDPTLGDWGDVSKPEDDLTFAAVSRTFVHTA